MPNGKLDSVSVADVAGVIADLLAKLAGKDAPSWLVEFKKFLRKENTWAETVAVAQAVASPSSAPRPWKTITLGFYKTAEEYAASFKAKGYELTRWGADILAKIPLARRPRKLDLYLVLDTDLGLTAQYSFAELRAAVKEHGYRKCPAQVGPDLREQYADQPVGEWALVFMEPVLVSDSYLRVFSVERGSYGTYLDTDDANPEARFNLGARWVVCRPAASV